MSRGYATHVPGDTPIVTDLRQAMALLALENEFHTPGSEAFSRVALAFHRAADAILTLTGEDPRRLDNVT